MVFIRSHKLGSLQKDFSAFFEGINGTAVFYNPTNNNFDVYNKDLYENQVSPCSTFKVISTLIGLESSLKISPKEQTQVLYEIFGQDNKYSERSKEILKNIMLVFEEDNFKVYGKTGAGYEDNRWFVGMIENGTENYYFAIRLSDKDNEEATSSKAREIAKDYYKIQK